MNEKSLNQVIEERLKLSDKEIMLNKLENNNYIDYIGFDMSGYGFDTQCLNFERTFIGKDKCRVENWLLFIDKFRDYLPIGINDFKLWAWEGDVWWGDEDNNNYKDQFNGWSTHDIIHWIIDNINTKGEKINGIS